MASQLTQASELVGVLLKVADVGLNVHLCIYYFVIIIDFYLNYNF